MFSIICHVCLCLCDLYPDYNKRVSAAVSPSISSWVIIHSLWQTRVRPCHFETSFFYFFIFFLSQHGIYLVVSLWSLSRNTLQRSSLFFQRLFSWVDSMLSCDRALKPVTKYVCIELYKVFTAFSWLYPRWHIRQCPTSVCFFLLFTGAEGTVFPKSIETPNVRADPFKELR